jgi:endonuclease/exonuclease/phosphatase family metal-dependent hydrolase
VLCWNIGYAGLGKDADFFMDGGSHTVSAGETQVRANLAGIKDLMDSVGAPLTLLQEVDRDSSRTWRIDERAFLAFGDSFYALNYACPFVPYPLPPLGRVYSGLLTVSAFDTASAERVALPCPFSWPIRAVNLKRCLLVTRIPLAGGGELVLVNLHLEAYDSGEGKAAQTAALAALLQEEADKGNYVVAGGDFNQIFSSADTGAYPAQPGKWTSGEIDVSQFPDGGQFLMDAAVPSCRSLDRPYAGADRESWQCYLIDGLLVSSNVTVDSLATQDLGFVVSDHNPVLLHITLN